MDWGGLIDYVINNGLAMLGLRVWCAASKKSKEGDERERGVNVFFGKELRRDKMVVLSSARAEPELFTTYEQY